MNTVAQTGGLFVTEWEVPAQAQPETAAGNRRQHPTHQPKISDWLVQNVTYLTADPVEIGDALEMGYLHICQHPIEVGILELHDLLIVDMNFVLFSDTAMALQLIHETAQRGIPVGIHTYNVTPAIAAMAKLPGVYVAKTHLQLWNTLLTVLATTSAITVGHDEDEPVGEKLAASSQSDDESEPHGS